MSDREPGNAPRPVWFVGAAFGGKRDQSERFLSEGVWEIDTDKYVDTVRSVLPGDRIILKSRYTRKNGLPFDNKGKTVAVMAIKSVGTVLENGGDGHRLKVRWTPLDSPREWYGYIYWGAITAALPGKKETDNLIAFALDGVEQDFEYFLRTPYWKSRFGEGPRENPFAWTAFYEAFADKLMDFKNDRAALLEIIYRVAATAPAVSSLSDTYRDGTKGPLKDICPFTTLGIFNRNQTFPNRRRIAEAFARELGISEAIPEAFDGIPTLFAQKTWFFPFERDRAAGDIDGLWNVFESALALAENDDDANREDFLKKYDMAAAQSMVGWNLSMGLYWARPWYFPALDSKARAYIEGKLNIKIDHTNLKGYCSASEYLALRDGLDRDFQNADVPVNSFPELSLAAWTAQVSPASEDETAAPDEDSVIPESPVEEMAVPTYTVDDIMASGCFLEKERLETIVELLRIKKNVILQGAPGTGKTWLAKKLAYALLGKKDPQRVRSVQFHPTMSYEDFVRGWRPSADGKLAMVEGPFLQWVNLARKSPEKDYVFIIEEINRGNPAQIFGELLTLLEADKRKREDALLLNYHLPGESEFYIPSNVHVIGTMNVADRSLALVDYALRRRFAFVDLEPLFNERWKSWLVDRFSMKRNELDRIAAKMNELNAAIAAEADLGKHCRIGHSFFIPPSGCVIDKDTPAWFADVVTSEIEPLLNEYWFDDPQKVKDHIRKLLEG